MSARPVLWAMLALLLLAARAGARNVAAVQPEELLGQVVERCETAPRPVLDTLGAPRPGAVKPAALAGGGPLDPLAARRTLVAPEPGRRLAVLDAAGDGQHGLVAITRRPDGSFLHEVRPGLPGGGFAPAPAWSVVTRDGHWLSGDYLPLAPKGLPGRLVVEQRPFGLLGLRAATRLAYHPCGPDGCAQAPAWRLAVKGGLDLRPGGAGVRDADGDGRPDLLFVDAMAPSLSLGGLAADLAAGRAWMELRLHLQRFDGTFAEAPDQELRLPLGLDARSGLTWRAPDDGGPPLLLVGDPAAPSAVLRYAHGALRPFDAVP